LPLYAIQLLTKKETKTLRACNSKTPLPFYLNSILFSEQFVNYLEKGFEKSSEVIEIIRLTPKTNSIHLI